MKIVFVSNYFNHHQKQLCDTLYSETNGNFNFIATSEMREERKKLGYGLMNIPDYVIHYVGHPEREDEVKKLISDADAVLFGSAPEELIKKRRSDGKLVFRYSERLFKKGIDPLRFIYHYFGFRIRNPRNQNIYLLCSSAYTFADYKKFHLFGDRAYKWGYFPEFKKYDIEELERKKSANTILWCGRFIDWKHPDDAIAVAKRLKTEGYDFRLNIIGMGNMENQMRTQIAENELEEHVFLLGSMKPEQVREHMVCAGIYLITSDFQEGWGAVLNESMNSGCAVIASHAVGAAPYLIKNRVNGLLYKSGDTNGLFDCIGYLLDRSDEQKRMGKNAYRTIEEVWNAESAAKRFIKLVETVTSGNSGDSFSDGPCSRATLLNNDWFSYDVDDKG